MYNTRTEALDGLNPFYIMEGILIKKGGYMYEMGDES